MKYISLWTPATAFVALIFQSLSAVGLETDLDLGERREHNRSWLLERKQAFYQVSDLETVSAVVSRVNEYDHMVTNNIDFCQRNARWLTL